MFTKKYVSKYELNQSALLTLVNIRNYGVIGYSDDEVSNAEELAERALKWTNDMNQMKGGFFWYPKMSKIYQLLLSLPFPKVTSWWMEHFEICANTKTMRKYYDIAIDSLKESFTAEEVDHMLKRAKKEGTYDCWDYEIEDLYQRILNSKN